MLGNAAKHVAELMDRRVDVTEGPQGVAMARAEGLGEHVVVDIVDVDGANARIQLGGDDQGIKLA